MTISTYCRLINTFRKNAECILGETTNKTKVAKIKICFIILIKVFASFY